MLEEKKEEEVLQEAKFSQLRNKTQIEDPERIKRGKDVKTAYIGMSKFGILNFKTTSRSRPGHYHYQIIEFKDLEPFNKAIKKNGKVMPIDIKSAIQNEDINIMCTCFIDGTKVLMANGTYKNIEDVEIGEYVITHTGNKQQVTANMKEHFIGNLVCINGIKSTPNHPYLVLNGDTIEWKQAKDITADMKLLKPAKKYGYIYMTTNLINGKKYIGQHSKDYIDLDYYGSGSALKEAVDKYGKDNFKIDVLEWCYSKEELDTKEKYYIEQYNANKSRGFYNLQEGGRSFNCKGYKLVHKGDLQHYVHPNKIEEYIEMGFQLGESEYRISKKSEISKKAFQKQEYLDKREDINKRVSNTLKEKYKTEMHKNKGKHLSKEHKKKIGLSQKGKVVSNETKKKMSVAASRWQKGRVISQETKNKISKALKVEHLLMRRKRRLVKGAKDVG